MVQFYKENVSWKTTREIKINVYCITYRLNYYKMVIGGYCTINTFRLIETLSLYHRSG